jgi:hypothetical protein
LQPTKIKVYNIYVCGEEGTTFIKWGKRDMNSEAVFLNFYIGARAGIL